MKPDAYLNEAHRFYIDPQDPDTWGSYADTLGGRFATRYQQSVELVEALNIRESVDIVPVREIVVGNRVVIAEGPALVLEVSVAGPAGCSEVRTVMELLGPSDDKPIEMIGVMHYGWPQIRLKGTAELDAPYMGNVKRVGLNATQCSAAAEREPELEVAKCDLKFRPPVRRSGISYKLLRP